MLHLQNSVLHSKEEDKVCRQLRNNSGAALMLEQNSSYLKPKPDTFWCYLCPTDCFKGNRLCQIIIMKWALLNTAYRSACRFFPPPSSSVWKKRKVFFIYLFYLKTKNKNCFCFILAEQISPCDWEQLQGAKPSPTLTRWSWNFGKQAVQLWGIQGESKIIFCK